MATTPEVDIRIAFLEQLVATPEGRQHMLSVSVDAEEGDEGGVFDRLAEVVDDPKLRRIVLQHRDDEARHAQLFRDCLARTGLHHQAVPDELKIIRHIAGTVGPSRTGIEGPEDVVRTYAVLLAIEERGVEQFPLIADAFRPHDPQTADVYRRVARDERGHVQYCRRIGRHYAPDDATWELTLAGARALEAHAFSEVARASLTYCTGQGWVTLAA
jgi:rubrerythrin